MLPTAACPLASAHAPDTKLLPAGLGHFPEDSPLQRDEGCAPTQKCIEHSCEARTQHPPQGPHGRGSSCSVAVAALPGEPCIRTRERAIHPGAHRGRMHSGLQWAHPDSLGAGQLCTPANQKAHVPSGNAPGNGVPAGQGGPAWRPCVCTQRIGGVGVSVPWQEEGTCKTVSSSLLRQEELSFNFWQSSLYSFQTLFKKSGLPTRTGWGTRMVWHLCKARWAQPARVSGLPSWRFQCGGTLPTSALRAKVHDSIQPDLSKGYWTSSFLKYPQANIFLSFLQVKRPQTTCGCVTEGSIGRRHPRRHRKPTLGPGFPVIPRGPRSPRGPCTGRREER